LLHFPYDCQRQATQQVRSHRDLGTPVAGTVPEGIFDGVTLTYASSGGIFQDGRRDPAWDPFAKISGATFLQDASDAGKLKAMVDSGNVSWDITNATQFDTARGCGTLYEEYDYSQVDISKVPEGTIVDKCMVLNIHYGLVVAHNTDAIGDNPPTSALISSVPRNSLAGAPVAPMRDEWRIMVDSTAVPKGVKDPQAAFVAVNFYLYRTPQPPIAHTLDLGNALICRVSSNTVYVATLGSVAPSQFSPGG